MASADAETASSVVDPWPAEPPKPLCGAPRSANPYIALATFLEPTAELWNFYRDRAAELGYQVGRENFGYLQKLYVADTEENAQEMAKFDMFGGAGPGYSLFAQPAYSFPPGYNPGLLSPETALWCAEKLGLSELRSWACRR